VGLTLRLLGPPHVEVDGRPLDVDTRKATALLTVLAVRGDRVGRDVIAPLLWADAGPERARASLRRTLSSLTSGLGGRYVRTDHDLLWLDTDDEVRCDVHEVRTAARVLRHHDADHGGDPASCTRCREALCDVGDDHGPLLEGFTLRATPGFEEWVQVAAEGLRRETALLLERRTALQLSEGAGEDALATAHRWLDLDPLHEQAHRAVMRAALTLGRRDDVIRQYRRCVETLDRELGVAPLPETTSLYERCLGAVVSPREITPGATTAAAARSRAPTHPSGGEASLLVDRDEELATLQRALRRLDHGAACVAIEGEAGIGKTRITEEFTEYAAGRGSRTVTVSCREGEAGLTCGPLTDLLRDAARSDPTWVVSLAPAVLAEVARIVPELAADRALPPLVPLESPGAQVGFLDGIFEALAAVVTGPAAGVLVVEDLHWADPTTIDVLSRGLHRYQGAPVLVVTTWRSEVIGHDHPLRRLQRTAEVTTLTPGRLTADQVAELVADLRPSASAMAGRLHEETEGIPFFVVQYLAAMDEGRWAVPGPVRDLVAARLAQLSDLARQCLTAGAVLGRSFDLDTLVRTSGRSEDEVVTALDELLERGLLRERAEGPRPSARYDFTHAKIREVVDASASLARRRLLHRRAAEATAASSAGDPAVASRVAHHLRAAGEDRLAAEQHAIAGEHARALFANVEALEHLQHAVALGHPDVVALQLEIGDLHALEGRYTDARDSYTAAAARAEDDVRRAELEHRLGALHLRWGAWAVAGSHLEQAAALLDGAGGSERVPCLRARVRGDLALVLLRSGDTEAATRTVEHAIAEARGCGDDQAIAEARNTAGLVARHGGRTADARDHLRTALAHAERLHDPAARVAALNNLALVLAADGDTDGALATALDALTCCRELGDRHRQAAIHSNVADLLHTAGRTDEALPHLTESARLLADVGEATRPDPEVWKLTDW
jgi:DNA-binding SARP family transcriptional activator